MSPGPTPAPIAAAIAAAVLCAAPARAEEEKREPSETEMKQAEELFKQGLEAYNDEKYAQALVHFLDSYDLNPFNEILYNIAYCYEQIDQDKKAIEYYERYLDTLPEDEEKERAKVMAKIEELEGIEEEEGEGESKGKKFKKKITSSYKGAWMHGLGFTIAFDMDPQNPAYPHGSHTSGLGLRGGYHVRLVDRKLDIGAEIGFLGISTLEQHYYNFIICPNISGRVGNWVGGTLQLYVGGVVDLKWYFTKTSIVLGASDPRVNFFSIGFGPLVRLYWHWGEKIGLFTEVGGVMGLVPKRSFPLHGYIMFRLGLFFGLV